MEEATWADKGRGEEVGLSLRNIVEAIEMDRSIVPLCEWFGSPVLYSRYANFRESAEVLEYGH